MPQRESKIVRAAQQLEDSVAGCTFTELTAEEQDVLVRVVNTILLTYKHSVAVEIERQEYLAQRQLTKQLLRGTSR